MLLATGVAVIARHPIARAIGTEQDQPTLTPSVVATTPPSFTTQTAPSVGALVAPAPTHAPRDPFRSLITAGQAILGPTSVGVLATNPVGAVTSPVASAATPPATSTSGSPAASASTCTGTVHRVVVGDTLWSIAAKAVKSSDTGRVNVAWHRIYAANTPPLGDNPSLVPVGAKLCIPSSI